MNSGFDMFQNSGYKNVRNRKKTLILDIEDDGVSPSPLSSTGEFNIKLYEPLIIDKHSEVYLDNFLTFNSNIASNTNQMAFLLKINEFNVNSNVASTHGATGNQPGGVNIFNSIVIPNDHSDPTDYHTAVAHKAKKFNYICDINPQTINSISGKITNLAGDPIFHGGLNTNTDTYALTGIVAAKILAVGTVTFPLQVGDRITQLQFAGQSFTVTGTILVSTTTGASTILFSLNQRITDANLMKLQTTAGNIIFTIIRDGNSAPSTAFTSTTLTIDNTPLTNNPNIQLIHGNGRFISEFSIIARE